MKNLSRRDMLKIMGIGASGMAMGPLLGPASAFAAARDKELNILCWEGYNSAQVLDPFRALSGATIKAESLTNDPTMINRLRGGETRVWDLINVNNPWARKVMAPAGLIKPLPRDEFEPFFDTMLPQFKAPYEWAMSEDGQQLLGMAQRFGPFNYVVNTDRISRATAEDTGWDLFNDPALNGKYGIQESDDWNVFDIFLIAGINPFVAHSGEEMQRFEQTAVKVFKGARMVSDVASLNQAIVSGEIDLYLTGGTYTASPARADGYPEIRGITPLRGPVDGKGGVSWVEVTSVVNNPNLSPLAYDFLKYVQQPEVAHQVAFAEGTFNPVSQMGNPECFKLFSKEELEILQWDSLEEEMARCVAYDIVPEYDQALEIISAAKRMR
ncbi:ABC transporter substrate-binding protein [Stutzerimonas kirkiae]|uniref:Spermidine/putrescine ABC transporter substrate-binding protein n=1 Tax=Stutzerimonas kirkiae TaxID=2211392 RepID=A0A4Q9R2G3_9GAMM|nr:PotD/PotF family extracellular solute-binding protein [Stutzerimonas kirkiae]TBU92657.1 spermidine/putrescine ABC transporter substrate-binding protein [Stutzerimonas kirkiae]TBV00848.1 spermidine/putrescine ABC transporter substrate-binding protein [Stutzerimonas kirkiae]TBV08740.1 spermidine/putrescine ABC transporter substrate-binding protein [Stutzerimonas kirkiae]TBV11476.1 spermidine/putrescine ABC transporter substrate-binding protein [Stutzerimonas kirkiae]